MQNNAEIVLEKAKESDVNSIYSIIQKRCKWLDSNKINQWNVTRTYAKEYYIQKIKEGKFYVAKLQGKVIGTVMLQLNSQYYELNDDSIHMHHFATDIEYKGVGKEIIEKIKEIALNNSKKGIRLDNIGSNKVLNDYYEKNGFKQIGIIEPENYDGKNFGILRELKIS